MPSTEQINLDRNWPFKWWDSGKVSISSTRHSISAAYRVRPYSGVCTRVESSRVRSGGQAQTSHGKISQLPHHLEAPNIFWICFLMVYIIPQVFNVLFSGQNLSMPWASIHVWTHEYYPQMCTNFQRNKWFNCTEPNFPKHSTLLKLTLSTFRIPSRMSCRIPNTLYPSTSIGRANFSRDSAILIDGGGEYALALERRTVPRAAARRANCPGDRG